LVEVRSLYIPDNFLDEITINKAYNENLANEMKNFYKLKITELIKDRDSLSNTDTTLYSLEQIAEDLGINLDDTNKELDFLE